MSKELLAKHQVFRNILYCFLTDGQRFQFFKVTRVSDGFNFVESSVFIGTFGWQILLGILRSDLSELGYGDLSIPGVSNLQYLGKGGSCTAFKGLRDEGAEPVVVKIFDQTKQTTMRRERDTLLALEQGAISNVPLCWGVYDVLVGDTASDMKALVCYPVGNPVLPVKGGLPIRGKHLSELVRILQKAHDMGIVHRDIKPDNIFVLADDSILLNDWGISCPSSDTEMVIWEGTRAYCDPPDDGHKHMPTPAKDLQALVRCGYSMMFQETNLPLDMTYWTTRLESGMWLEAMVAAKSLNYDDLRRAFTFLRC
jgi:hypothetical protein